MLLFGLDDFKKTFGSFPTSLLSTELAPIWLSELTFLPKILTEQIAVNFRGIWLVGKESKVFLTQSGKIFCGKINSHKNNMKKCSNKIL